MPTSATRPSYGHLTRLLHGALALAVICQLLSSQIMQADDGGDWIFGIHQYAGLSALLLALGFWTHGALRRRGTPLGRLLPWASRARRGALGRDLLAHLRAARSYRPLDHDAGPDGDALASAIHGLGLTLITAMAVSGAVYYAVNTGNPDAGGLVGLTIEVHEILANLVWAYLIGHSAMAALQHRAGRPLARMWSPKP